jgi:hypothetical protein
MTLSSQKIVVLLDLLQRDLNRHDTGNFCFWLSERRTNDKNVTARKSKFATCDPSDHTG